MKTTDNAVRMADLLRLAMQLADRAAVSDIEMHAVRERAPDGTNWRDMRPMIDEREHSPAVIDMNREALRYASERGLIVHNTLQPHLVRIVRSSQDQLREVADFHVAGLVPPLPHEEARA